MEPASERSGTATYRGPLFAELCRLQDECYAASNAELESRRWKPGHPQRVAAEVRKLAAEDALDAFRRGMLRELELQLRYAEQSPRTMDPMVRAVCARLADLIDFDSLRQSVAWAGKEMQKMRYQMEEMQKEINRMRAIVEEPPRVKAV